MHAKLRIAFIAAGVVLFVVLALLVATTLTGSRLLAAVTIGVSLVFAIGGLLLILKVMARYTRAANRTATQLSNLEKRLEHVRAADVDAVAELRAETTTIQEGIAPVERLVTVEEQVATHDRAVRTLRRRVPDGYLDPVTTELAALKSEMHAELSRLDSRMGTIDEHAQDSWTLGAESAFQLGRRPRSFLSVKQAADLFEHYLQNGRYLELGPLISQYKLLTRLDLGTLRTLYRFYKAAGYWDLAALTLKEVSEKSHRGGDAKALAKLQRDITVFSKPAGVAAELPSAYAHDPAGPILHMVGRVLPETQSGFTLRTHYTARAQARRGLRVAVVGQSGVAEDAIEKTTKYTYDGVDYYRLSGPPRAGVLIDAWLRHNIEQLAELVRELRPSVLHAHSDFQNALIVNAVGRAYGIPTVYETRGFWEESWLTRAISTNGWDLNADSLFATYGHPGAYALRKHAEEVARGLIDYNFTLAEVMKDHILESAGGALDDEEVSVVPNGVDGDEFPIQMRDPELASQIGIPEDAVTIGYISSMVEYESIETLIDGFKLAAGWVSGPLYLLLVGDGKRREALEEHAAKAGIENVIFTGAVPHEQILQYYGLIDVFVVPRRKSSVADLVTPLKPFEAFATGRAVVLSDVDALREIADDSGAVQLFHAGDSRDLGRKLRDLVNDPQRRRSMGARAGHWVRSQRSWDRNVTEYFRVYRELGYRGPAEDTLEEDLRRRTTSAKPVPAIEHHEEQSRDLVPRVAAPIAIVEPSGPAELGISTESPSGRGRRAAATAASVTGKAPRAVVVAMKPQIAGRIRRNIMTLLELGFEVTVVNSTPRADFFQGLDHPNLVADFVDVRSLAVLYQARMTRKKNERAAKWDQEKKNRAVKAAEPERDAPEWMSNGVPGTEVLYRGWTSESGQDARKRLEEVWTDTDKRVTKFLNTSRQKRDLKIRDELKQVHLINRFVEFWRLSPDRIAEHKPDLIMSDDLPGLVGASIAARRLGVPHIHDCHELYLESTTLRPYERRVLWPVEKAYMKRADSVVIVNETIRDEYEKRYGVRGIVLRNAAPAVPAEVRSNPMDLRALAGIPRHSKVVLYQGGLVPGRGLDVCVKAAVHFPDDVHLVLVGKGKMHDELVAMMDELGVADRVHFLPAVEPGELPAYTAGADVGVIPYQPVSRNNEYALPNKAFEYPAAGIPFVAADLPELRRIAEAARCGEVYDAFSPEALAAAVRTVLDPERYSAYQQNAVTFGRENTWESERKILVEEIRRLTSRRVAD